MPSLEEMFAWQFLNPDSDLVGNREGVEACKVFAKAMEPITLRRRFESWAVPVGLVPMQTFPVDILHLFENLYKEVALCEKYQHILLSQRLKSGDNGCTVWTWRYCLRCTNLLKAGR